MSDLVLRTGTADDLPGILDLLSISFHVTDQELFTQRTGDLIDPERSVLVVDESIDSAPVVAHTTAYTRDLTVPGAVLPAAHVTMVATLPTHRRRGLTRQVLTRQLAEAPEPVAVLWASEPAIYGRFGYGIASTRLSLTVETDYVRLPEPEGPSRVRLVPQETAAPLMRQLYEEVRSHRPGWSSRSALWWERRVLADPPSRRNGATERRIVVHEGQAGPDGYAAWRVRENFSETGATGEVLVEDLVATNSTAQLGLWRFLTSVDLTNQVRMWRGWVGDPLVHLVDDVRRLGMRPCDGLFVRITNLPEALAARRYQLPVDVVLEVTDPLLPANTGRWRLTGGPEQARCVPTTDPADLACSITELGAAYLGGTSLTALATAGRVRELRTGTLVPASVGFGWPVPPGAMDVF
jgi:predicted acetyltransferase